MPTANQTLHTDILCIGAGVASLSTALALLRAHKKSGSARAAPRVVILEKSRGIANHVLSGAVIDPTAFDGLLDAEEIRRLPFEAEVTQEAFHFLGNARRSIPIPWIPPMMRAQGYPVGSLSKLTRHLAMLCEAEGAEIYCGFAASEWMEDASGRITGVRTGPRGLDRQGQPKSNFAPPEEIHARAVVLGEGACGHLTERLIARSGLQGRRPQSYAVGIKEVIEMPDDPERAGRILHTFGYPADSRSYGGGFVYQLSATQAAVGYAYGLDYRPPETDPHELFRRFKAHPAVAREIEGGKAVAYGAKVIPEGGLFSVPELVTDGALIVGDGGGLLDSLRIKGIHMAMQSGRMAGETLAAAWERDDFSRAQLSNYPRALRASNIWQQLKRVRNVRAPFSKHSLLGLATAGAAWATRGALPWWMIEMERDHVTLRPKNTRPTRRRVPPLAASPLSPDRLTDVFMSGTTHDEDQPCHLHILDRAVCRRCIELFGAPCQHFCPAEVYRLEGEDIHIDFSNCLHCKTCQIKDPYANIEWTPPQAADGPRYTRM